MRPTWAIAALGLAFAACGAAEPNRFDLTTPGAHTGDGIPAATSAPNPSKTPKAKATATPKPSAKKPVTRAEKRVIKGWSDSLRQGHVTAAARYFAVPTFVSNNQQGYSILGSKDEVEEFNRTLPCGAKLLRTRRSSDDFVVGIFRLTERPNAPAPCGTGVGNMAAVAFEIDKGHITKWVRVDDAGRQDPSATPTPTATASATPTTS
jgi:hypothetical protein